MARAGRSTGCCPTAAPIPEAPAPEAIVRKNSVKFWSANNDDVTNDVVVIRPCDCGQERKAVYTSGIILHIKKHDAKGDC